MESEVSPNGTPDSSTPRALSILVVDDELLLRKMMARYLENMGHKVFLAEDGLEALRLFREVTCDLVITDYVMPHKGGDVLAADIKKLSPGTPVILMTGFQTPVSSKAIDHRVQKPLTPGDLQKAIAETVKAQSPPRNDGEPPRS